MKNLFLFVIMAFFMITATQAQEVIFKEKKPAKFEPNNIYFIKSGSNFSAYYLGKNLLTASDAKKMVTEDIEKALDGAPLEKFLLTNHDDSFSYKGMITIVKRNGGPKVYIQIPIKIAYTFKKGRHLLAFKNINCGAFLQKFLNKEFLKKKEKEKGEVIKQFIEYFKQNIKSLDETFDQNRSISNTDW